MSNLPRDSNAIRSARGAPTPEQTQMQAVIEMERRQTGTITDWGVYVKQHHSKDPADSPTVSTNADRYSTNDSPNPFNRHRHLFVPEGGTPPPLVSSLHDRIPPPQPSLKSPLDNNSRGGGKAGGIAGVAYNSRTMGEKERRSTRADYKEEKDSPPISRPLSTQLPPLTRSRSAPASPERGNRPGLIPLDLHPSHSSLTSPQMQSSLSGTGLTIAPRSLEERVQRSVDLQDG